MFIVPEQSPMLLAGSRDRFTGKEVKGSAHDGTSAACSHAHTWPWDTAVVQVSGCSGFVFPLVGAADGAAAAV